MDKMTETSLAIAVVCAIILNSGVNCDMCAKPEFKNCKCADKSKLNCSGSGLRHLPFVTSADVKELILDLNPGLANKQRSSFNVAQSLDLLFPSLEILSANNNSITTLEGNLLGNCPKLKRFSAKGNQIITISSEFFRSCQELTVLELQANKLSHFSYTSIQNCNELEKLHLEYNQLASIELNEQHNTKLQRLLLKSNKLKRLPSVVLDKFKLTTLDISNNEISRLSENKTFNVPHLMFLHAQNNLIKELPSNWHCPKLFTLILNGNKIKRLATHLTQCRSMLMLLLQNNSITEIEANSFHLFARLRFLYLHNNQIQSLPKSFLASSMFLGTLYLHNNKLKTIPNNALPKSKLKLLDLSGNAFHEVPTKSLQYPVEIDKLSLNNMRQLKITPNSFEEVQVKYIHIDDSLTTWTNLHSEAFQCITSLTRLSIITTKKLRCNCQLNNFRYFSDYQTIKLLGNFACGGSLFCDTRCFLPHRNECNQTTTPTLANETYGNDCLTSTISWETSALATTEKTPVASHKNTPSDAWRDTTTEAKTERESSTKQQPIESGYLKIENKWIYIAAAGVALLLLVSVGITAVICQSLSKKKLNSRLRSFESALKSVVKKEVKAEIMSEISGSAAVFQQDSAPGYCCHNDEHVELSAAHLHNERYAALFGHTDDLPPYEPQDCPDDTEVENFC